MPLVTSTGHAMSEANWLDTHFQSARQEYEEALRYVGMMPGWSILDAGCGGGGYLQLSADLVGPAGRVEAMDLAPENVDRVEALTRSGHLGPKINARIGSVLALPYGDAEFDCVWLANVMQYLSEQQSRQAIDECKRVVKPGGLIAIKDFYDAFTQFSFIDPAVLARYFAAKRRHNASRDAIGLACGATLPARLRQAELHQIRRRSWIVERWAPIPEATLMLCKSFIPVWSEWAQTSDLDESDKQYWRETVVNLDDRLSEPDCWFVEGFVVAVGTKPGSMP